MIKRNVLTAVGIILSFVIAIGGWIVTSWLIDMESYRLLSGTRSFVVDIPTIESPLTDEENGNIRLGLTDNEIVSILRNWELTDYRRPHEPAAGQLDMEQAIASGRAGLDFLYNYNILPAEMMEFNNVGAILSQNIPQGGGFLPLRYSYWTVTFRNEDIDVVMTINAVTGQIWGMEVITQRRITPTPLIVSQILPQIDSREFSNMVSAFMSYLEIIPDREQPISVGYVLVTEYAGEGVGRGTTQQNFASGNAATVLSATGLPSLVPEEMFFSTFSIGLTALLP